MRPGQPKSLYGKLVLAILPLTFLVVNLIVWVQYASARSELLAAIDREIGILSRRAAGTVDDLLGHRYSDLFTVSETPLILDYHHNRDFGLLNEAGIYRGELEKFLRNFSARSGAYVRILYLDDRGREVCRVERSGAAARGASLTDFFSKVRALPPGGWRASSIEDLEGIGPVVYYGRPIRDESGKLRGVFVMGYDLAELLTVLKANSIGRRGGAHILTPEGRRLGGAAGSEVGGVMLRSASALRRLPWTVVAEAPLDDFLGPLKDMRNAALLTSLAGLALLTVILLFLVRGVTRPVAALVEAARRIGGGDLGYRIKCVGADELGLLCASFNEMGERLVENRRQTMELQAQLVQAEKLSAMGQLISAVAHEIKNPLAAVVGFAQAALFGDCPPALREDLERVNRNAYRCRKVVDNLLVFVRRSGEGRSRVRVNDAVQAALDLLQYRLSKTEDVVLALELSPDLPDVVGDFQQVAQVLVNLVNNACDAMSAVPLHRGVRRLRVATSAAPSGRGERPPSGDLAPLGQAPSGKGARPPSEDGGPLPVAGKVRIVVEDNGPGIPAEHRARVFEPFFTTKEPGKGTGLGLAICRQIVQAHGGDIRFETEDGKGTAFVVELPAADEEELARLSLPLEPESLPPVPGKRILVADDEADFADLMARVMREDGGAVDAAHGGAEALRLASCGSYDLVITDIEMEDVKGTDIFSELSRRSGEALPAFLFVTGDIFNPKVLEFLSRTKLPYLVKPFDMEALQQAARRLLS
ncbi:MAG: response regulator [Elusimicrobia bacterium]|nr:response regulator [Elusimicrobiota bacterium]